MSNSNQNDFEDDDDDLIEEDQNPSAYNSQETNMPNNANIDSSFPSINGKNGASGFGSFDGRMNPLNDFGMSMGSGFGGGFDRFGSNFMGLRFSEYDGHPRHSHDTQFQKSFLQQFNVENGSSEKKEQQEKKKEQKSKEPEESEKERLARLAKKIDIPEEQQLTLVDWAIRGPAQVIRLVMEYILIPYKERKYVFKTKDEWFKQDKLKLLDKYPGIQLPYLQDGEQLISGTEAIIFYLLHKYNRTELLGNTPEEHVRVVTAASIYWDLLEDYYELVYGEYDDKLNWEKAKEIYINQRFRPKLIKIVSFLKSKSGNNNNEEFVWVDFAIAETVSILNEMDYRFKEQTTYVQNYLAKVFTLPQFIVYRQSTRFHERPYNGLGAIYK